MRPGSSTGGVDRPTGFGRRWRPSCAGPRAWPVVSQRRSTGTAYSLPDMRIAEAAAAVLRPLTAGIENLAWHRSGSCGGDVVDIERDGGQAAAGGAVGRAAVDAAAGGEGQAVEGLVALGVVRDWVAS